jgi:hypothetical protein
MSGFKDPSPHTSLSASVETATLAAHGKALLSAGQFDKALDAFQQVITLDPSHRAAHLSVAALKSKKGDKLGAQAFLRDFYARVPLGPPPPVDQPADPLVLRLRGFDKTAPVIGKSRSGEYKTKLRGGHFTTQYLLPNKAIAQRTMTLSGPAPLRLENFPPYDLLLNTIAEPDVEEASLKKLHQFSKAHPEITILNRPDKVWDTARDRNWRRLKHLSQIQFPRTERVSFVKPKPGNLAIAIKTLKMDLPVIVRKTGTQTGRTTDLITTQADLDRYANRSLKGDYYIIAYRQILWQHEFFRKLRIFCIDGVFFPVVCHLDKVWNVHGGNRKEIMRTRDDLMAEEKRFLADWQGYVGPANVTALRHVAELTDLEFFGIDFTIDEEGRIFIYELNASMRHSFDHAQNFPYKLPYDHAITAAFTKMVLSRIPQVRATP